MTVLKRSILSLFAITALSSTAHAHISMKGPLQSRGGDQKQSPCDGSRGDGMVYTFAPGATITLAVNEDIPHPSYFRIAFDNDGEDFVEPASIDPIDPNRACPFDKDDQCGKSDYCTSAGTAKGAVVLWDNLDPHLSNAAKGGSWNVKLPDVECENCTIQVLQVMEDTVHGAYCPQGSCAASGNSLEDIYHRCIDVKLVKGAANGPGTTTEAISNMGMECPSAPTTSGQAGAAGSAAGSGGSGTSSAANGGSMGSATAGSAATAGSGGSMMQSMAAAGVSGSPTTSTPTTTTTSAAAAGTGARSDSATSAGAAGKPASSSGTPSSGTAGSTSSAKAEASTTTPTEAPKTDDGGCAVTQLGSQSSFASAALVSLMTLLFAARRRRRLDA